MMRRNWVSPAPLEHTPALNAPIKAKEGEGAEEGERKPSQKQANSTTIDERKGPATLGTKPSKRGRKGR
jgi:hypothetical protein